MMWRKQNIEFSITSQIKNRKLRNYSILCESDVKETKHRRHAFDAFSL